MFKMTYPTQVTPQVTKVKRGGAKNDNHFMFFTYPLKEDHHFGPGPPSKIVGPRTDKIDG